MLNILLDWLERFKLMRWDQVCLCREGGKWSCSVIYFVPLKVCVYEWVSEYMYICKYVCTYSAHLQFTVCILLYVFTYTCASNARYTCWSTPYIERYTSDRGIPIWGWTYNIYSIFLTWWRISFITSYTGTLCLTLCTCKCFATRWSRPLEKPSENKKK